MRIKALCHVDLIDVAGSNVVLCPLYHCTKLSMSARIVTRALVLSVSMDIPKGRLQ